MGNFCDEIQKLGKGIGSPVRYRIMEALLKGPRTVSQLTRTVKLSQPAVSQHLKTLKTCRLVTDEKRGQAVYYAINVEHAVGLLKHLVENLKRCEKNRR